MGLVSSRAENVVNELLTQSMSVDTKIVQDCSGKLNNTIGYRIVAKKDVTLNGGIVTNQTIWLNLDCAQKGTSSTDVEQELKNTVTQWTESLATAGFGLTSSEAKNVTNIATNLAMAVSTAFIQNLTPIAQNDCTVDIESTDGSVTINGLIEGTQTINLTSKAAMESDAVTKAKQSLEQAISQTAKAKARGMGGMLLLLIILIVAVLGIGAYSVKYLLDPRFWLAILIIGGGLLAAEYFLKWWPYKRTHEDDDKDTTAKNKRNNDIILACASSAAVLGLAGEVLFAAYKVKHPAPPKTATK